MNMKNQTSLSATQVDVNAFLSIYATVLLKYNNNKIASVKPNLVKWYAEAKPFLDERPDVAKALTSCFNMVSLGKSPKPEQVEKLAEVLKDKKFLAFMDKATKVTPDQIKLMKQMTAHALAQTDEKIEATWERIRPRISLLGQPSLNLIFHGNLTTDGKAAKDVKVEVPASVKKAAAAVSALVKSITGRTNCYLTMREAMDLKAANPDLLKKYYELNKPVNALANATIRKLILSSGQDKVSIDVLIKKMQSLGVQNNLPIGFTGGQLSIVGSKIVAFTKEGKQMDAVPAGIVRMNPKYDPNVEGTYVCSGVGEDKKKYSTLSSKAGSKTGHFADVAEYRNNTDTYRQKWLDDLMSFDPKRDLGRPATEVVMAAVVELLHLTKHRIGGEKNATAGEQTYGLTTMRVSHVKLTDNSLTINYTGKKNADQISKVDFTGSPERQKLGQIMHALVDERIGPKSTKIPAKTKTDLVFTWRTKTSDKPLKAEAVRKYLKTHGIQMGPHGFRHAFATELAAQILAKAKFKPGKATQDEVNDWVKEKMKEVGKVLHHSDSKGNVTGLTALKSYIDPSVVINFYDKLGLRTPNFVPKLDDQKGK